MKKAALAAIVTSIFLVSIATGMQDIDETKANFGPIPTTLPTVTIENLVDSSTQSKNVTIMFNVTFFNVTFFGGAIPFRIGFSYKLDNQPSTSIQPTTIVSRTTQNSVLRQCRFTLLDLSDGPHRIQVSAKIGKTRSTDHDLTWNFVGVEGFSIPINFTVDSIAPRILVLSPENRTYNNSQLSLEWMTEEEASTSWYQLDNQEYVTVNGNSTLTGLSEGTHRLVIYANDTVGNVGKSDIVSFIIDMATPTQPHAESNAIFNANLKPD